MGVIDIIILVMFLAAIVAGYFRGFIKQVLSSLAWIIALIAAIFLCKVVGNMILDTSIGFNLNDTISGWISDKGEVFSKVIPSMTEEVFSEVLTKLKIPSILHKFLIGLVDVSDFQNTSISEFVSPKISSFILMIASFVIIFVVVFILIKVISKIFGDAVRGSALGVVDGVLGAIWGCFKVLILVSILMLALSFVVTLPFGESINEWVINDMRLNGSGIGIGRFFFEKNPILFIISKL